MFTILGYNGGRKTNHIHAVKNRLKIILTKQNNWMKMLWEKHIEGSWLVDF